MAHFQGQISMELPSYLNDTAFSDALGGARIQAGKAQQLPYGETPRSHSEQNIPECFCIAQNLHPKRWFRPVRSAIPSPATLLSAATFSGVTELLMVWVLIACPSA